MKKILAFDTSNNSCSVAISAGQDIISYVEELRPSMQAERLMPMIQIALQSAKLSYNELDYLAVINGPGSFTGIRIGLAAAKGILLASGFRGFSVTNFEMSHYRAKMQIKEDTKIYIVLNAYKGQLYLQIFDKEGHTSEPFLIEYDQAVAMLKNEKEIVTCAGSGLEFLYPHIKDLPNIIILPRFARIKALHICRYIDSLTTANPNFTNFIEPLYIRPPDAKVK